MTPEQARKALLGWFRALVLILLLGLPAYAFLKAGRQVDLNQNLLTAIRRNDANRVAFLLNAGADANTRAPLHDNLSLLQKIYAQMRGLPLPKGSPALMIHLDSKSVPTGRGNYTVMPAYPENVDLARALLEHHADPNFTESFGGDYGTTPLMVAIQQKKDKTAQLLLKYGAHVQVKDPQGDDALHHAVGLAGSAEVGLLLDAGADANSRDRANLTPLMLAVMRGHEAMIQLLIAHGADVNAKTDEGTLLDYARHNNQSSVIPLLKAAGAK